MRVLLIANTLPPADISGVGEQVLQLASGLEARGHDVEILGRGQNGAPGPKLLFPVAVVPAFLRRLREYRPHVVQVHESDGALVAFLTRVLGAMVAPRPVLTALLQVSYIEEIRAVRALRYRGEVLGRPGRRELVFRFFKAPIQVVFGCLTAWLADLVLAPSLVTAGEIVRDYKVGRVGVVPNVTGGLSWDEVEVRPARGRANLLYIGRLRIRKGVEVLLQAVAALRHQHRAMKLIIVGDGEQRQALEAMATREELDNAVDFLGRQSPEQVRRLLGTSSALVVPSIYEGMPLVILEAMERGVPVVASAVSGIPEVVVDGETGWLVPPEDPAELAHALGEILADPEEALRRGSAGWHRVVSHFRPANAAALWEREVSRETSLNTAET
jgi:glycosyltransferase involved in cell wall biosynthesis